MKRVLLKINNLNISIWTDSVRRPLTTGLNLEVRENQIVALVGSSGSGKTTTGLAVLRLLPPNISVHAGEILYRGKNVEAMTYSRIRQIRGKEIGMVFQEPLSAFNPVFTVGTQIEETIHSHLSLRRRQRRERVWDLLRMVGIDEPKRIAKAYPHQLSGGLRQRAMIAQAICAEPALLIADEPTSNLDVTLQARIIALFERLRSELRMSVLLITHDLGVVRRMADYAAVMYNGKVVDFGPTRSVLEEPGHSFTRKLVQILDD